MGRKNYPGPRKLPENDRHCHNVEGVEGGSAHALREQGTFFGFPAFCTVYKCVKYKQFFIVDHAVMRVSSKVTRVVDQGLAEMFD